ncbi:MAG: hypothetical protein JWN17_846 [Frankiales bacterium]|nr:hypothetical protein [Frankiales bacterium]
MTGQRRGVLDGALSLLVLVGVGAGLVVVALAHWRTGLYLLGAAVLAAAGIRSSLSERRAGLLVVRSRGLDVAVLLLLGTGVLLLANSVPAG